MLKIHAMLNAKGIDYQGTGGGIPTITPEMVAASLAAAPLGASALIRTKLGDERSRAVLVSALIERLVEETEKRRWGLSDKGVLYIEGIARTASMLYTTPMFCYRCRGRGDIKKRTGLVVPCPSCEGTGAKVLSEREIAKRCGIPWANWCGPWADRYQLALSILSEWEDEADRATKRVFWP
jgi:hypothetical protein